MAFSLQRKLAAYGSEKTFKKHAQTLTHLQTLEFVSEEEDEALSALFPHRTYATPAWLELDAQHSEIASEVARWVSECLVKSNLATEFYFKWQPCGEAKWARVSFTDCKLGLLELLQPLFESCYIIWLDKMTFLALDADEADYKAYFTSNSPVQPS